VAVREGGGFTPFALGASRTAIAAVLLFLWARLRNETAHSFLPTKKDAITLLVSSFAMWIGGNALVMVAERHVDSGLAALLVGTTPIFMTIVESVWDRKKPSLTLVLSMVIGFLGLGLLTLPLFRHGTRADAVSAAMLVIAPLSWGFGSVLQARRGISLSLSVSAGYQQLFASVFFLLFAIGFGEPVPSPSTDALIAFWYLVIMGSVVSFTAYLIALKSLPVSVVSTYAYVNPVIAVLLGALFLDEALTLYTLIGSALIVVGIFGVFRGKPGR
jgi:drug/metabolite transporter (DMT)-like permease